MGDEVMSIPVPGEGAKAEAWKRAQEALQKTQGVSRGGAAANGNNSTGQNSWMNNPFPYPSANPASSYGQFGGGWHPSSWNSGPVAQQSTVSAAAANATAQAAYNQTSYNYQGAAAAQSQQNWAGYGKGRGGGGGTNWNQQGQQKQFQPFALNKRNNQGAFPHLTNSFVPQAGAGGSGPQPLMGIARQRPAPAGGPQQAPPAAQRYIERAFEAANTAEDRQKTQEYLQKRLYPMLNAGNAHMVNWDIEPLPHEKNYELASMAWTPAKQLPHQANGFHRKKSPPRRRSDEMNNGGGSVSKRARRESDASSDSDKSDKIEILHNQKKTKAQKKAEKAAKKLKKQQEQQKKNKWKIDESLDTDSRREDRARRFAESLSAVSKPTVTVQQHFFRRGQVVRGTCQSIEKSFFRLTAAPDPSAVRPLEILRLSLENVRNKYRSKAEYSYLTSQLRSIRQDLTVQRIRNAFTVEVYEVNARISLENADREEFNKCQSQLKLLYSELEAADINSNHHAEFVSYRLLYYIAMDNQIDINSLLKELTPELKKDMCVDFALKVRKAVTMNNYIKFFKLFKEAPKMCPYLMDLFVERERKKAISTMTKAYRPTMTYQLMASFLKMEEDDLVDWLVEDLKWTDAVVGGTVDCKVPRNV